MKDWWIRIVIIGLLAVIVGVPFALRPRPEQPADATVASALERLVIVSPHNEQIRYEFSRAFNQWRAKQGLGPVVFDWRTSGGASDLRRIVLASYGAEAARAAAAGEEIGGIGYDLFFGGGDYELDNLARGIMIERDGVKKPFSVLDPIELPEGMLERVYPQPTIGGARLYHAEHRWLGAALSSFGIVYNRDVLAMLKLHDPRTWSDLQAPGYFNQLALADPAHSGSIGATYEIIVRRMGWSDGWPLLRRVFANARYFSAGATNVPVDVSAGEAAAGMCIDFYGRFQAGAVAGDQAVEDSRVGYVDPPFLTAINADPIGILHGAPSQLRALREGKPTSEGLANQFVVWLLSEQSQTLWQQRLGSEGGPDRFELRRLPVRQDLYTPQHMRDWTDQVFPFNIAAPFPEGMPGFYAMITPVSHAMAIDVHDDLRAAWEAIINHPDHPHRATMLKLFDQMPPELTVTGASEVPAAQAQDRALVPLSAEAVKVMRDFVDGLKKRYDGFKDKDKLADDRLRWTLFFRDNYREIVRLSKQK